MRHTTRIIALFVSTASLLAQSPEPREHRDGPPPRHPLPPLVAALDADRDGEISAEEIENAAAALAKLDKDGDGKLSRQELFPKPPMPRDEAHEAEGDGPRPPRDEQAGPHGRQGRQGPPPGGQRPPRPMPPPRGPQGGPRR